MHFKNNNKNLFIYYLSLFTTLIILNSCNLFETRTPAEPTTIRGNFIPPTEPDDVIKNLKNSIKEKISDNYIQCFWDSLQGTKNQSSYSFVASTDVYIKYSDIFRNWDRNKEKSAFLALVSTITDTVSPIVNLSGDFTIKLADSAVYSGNYYLEIKINKQVEPLKFSGAIQLTLIPQNGRWSIQRWIDAGLEKDTISTTWSVLKAMYSN
jgi:hypothetical protein